MISSSKTVKVLVPIVLGLSTTLVSLSVNIVTGMISQARSLTKQPLLVPFKLHLDKPPIQRTRVVRGPAPGVTETILYSFNDEDGAYPLSSVTLDKSQTNLYGTTFQGGADGYGTVFTFPINNPPATGTLTPLHSFNKTDGANPIGRLILDGTGKMYGTTNRGGTNDQGTVFTFDATGTPVTPQQHSFIGSDGSQPTAGVQRDSNGNLYGTTSGGGRSGLGAAFRLAPTGTLTVLSSFSLSNARPYGGVLRTSSGNLYGTTYLGGTSNKGMVFKLSPSGNLTVLKSFSGANGAYPYSTLVSDQAGNLYGTTCQGGTFNDGTVFKITAGTLTTLHSFNFDDGSCPITGVVLDKLGNLYGTTYGGGSDSNGTVFRIAANGIFTSLYSFDASLTDEGTNPWGGVTLDKALLTSGKGNLYGTTRFGGANNRGGVFKLNLN